MAKLPKELISEVQKYTNFPWWNGEAYASFVGYPQMIFRLKKNIEGVGHELDKVIEELREVKNYQISDKLRVLSTRLKEADLPQKAIQTHLLTE
jgi:hypothetical protein